MTTILQVLPFNTECLQQFCHQLVIKSNFIFILCKERAFYTNKKSPQKVPASADPSFPVSLGYYSDAWTDCIDCLCKFCTFIMAIISKVMDALTHKTACMSFWIDDFLIWKYWFPLKLRKWINIALASQNKDFNCTLQEVALLVLSVTGSSSST